MHRFTWAFGFHAMVGITRSKVICMDFLMVNATIETVCVTDFYGLIMDDHGRYNYI